MSHFKYNPETKRVDEFDNEGKLVPKPDENKPTKKFDKGKYSLVVDLKPKMVKKAKGMFVCDECKKTFDPATTLATSEYDGILDLTSSGIRSIKSDKKTYLLVSPCCHKIHPFGFFTSKLPAEEPYIEQVF